MAGGIVLEELKGEAAAASVIALLQEVVREEGELLGGDVHDLGEERIEGL
jgi:hypothetical protein